MVVKLGLIERGQSERVIKFDGRQLNKALLLSGDILVVSPTNNNKWGKLNSTWDNELEFYNIENEILIRFNGKFPY